MRVKASRVGISFEKEEEYTPPPSVLIGLHKEMIKIKS